MKTQAKFTMLAFLGLMGLTTGCGPGFKTAEVLEQTVSLSSVNGRDAKVQTQDGSLSWQTQISSSVELQFEMKVPYGRIHRLSSGLIRGLTPYTCQFIPGLMNSSPFAYNKGEIPCGAIIDQNWKQLAVIPVDPVMGNSDGFNYQVSGFNVPVWIARAQRAGTYAEANLDTKTVQSRTSSTVFGDDVSLRYAPSGSSARFELCMNLPGSTVTSNRQTISAKASKKVLGVKISYASDFDVDMGGVNYDYARGCFAADFGWQGSSLSPTLQLTTTQAPYLANAVHGGLKIYIRDWFLRLADNILGFFRSSLRVKAEKLGTSEANKVLDQDVETGRWFSKVHGEQTLATAAQKMTQQISKGLTRVGIPSSTNDVRAMIADSCRLKKLSGSQDWTNRVETLCRDLLEKIEVTVEPFSVDADSSGKGCYASFARVHESQGKWWASECQFSARFKIKIPLMYQDYQQELKLLLASRFSLDRIPDDWKNALEGYGVDELNLAEVLEELERQGYTQVTGGDWASRLQSVVAQIRARQATL
ncbi:MAG: hypothetical protein KF681_11945 [Bdellovibrionaceae bacterium]|nr:hypothetical protein [Pseudobdellovibrionaceae bacterium]